MSYSRFSDDSDVYIFHHVNGFIQCCGCLLNPGDPFSYETRDPEFYSRSEAIAHLERHVARGHNVPHHAFDSIRREIAQLSDTALLGRQKCRKVRLKRRPMKRTGPTPISRRRAMKSIIKWLRQGRIERWKKITDY